MLNRISLIGIACCLSGLGNVVSVGQDASRRDPPPQGGYEIDAAGLFTLLDTNVNGLLSSAEAGAQHDRLFRRLLRTSDENFDGMLSRDEFAAALQPIRAEKPFVRKQGASLPGSDALNVLLAHMDANSNQRLVRDEIPPKFRDLFERMLELADADKDSRLDPREIAREAPRLTRLSRLAARRLNMDVEAEKARFSRPPQGTPAPKEP